MGQKVAFAKDVLAYTFTAFGGPQAHFAMMLNVFVEKGKYLSESELVELSTLAQVLPGPSSSQTLAAIAYRIGGLAYAILIYILWILPSAIVMFLAAHYLNRFNLIASGTQVIPFTGAMAIGFVGVAATNMAAKTVRHPVFYAITGVSIATCLLVKSPVVYPVLILAGGFVASVFKASKEEKRISTGLITQINPSKFLYFIGVFSVFAVSGALINRTSPFSLPIRLFQNFYRNGVFIYGGGQVLVPYLLTEFVYVKKYLSARDFLTGYTIQQALPGPTFSFVSFIGALTMANAGFRFWGQLGGGLLAMIAINSPGLILMLFIIPFWDELKKITHVSNSVAGIHAVSTGLIIAALILLFSHLPLNGLYIAVAAFTYILLTLSRLPAIIIVLGGLLIGYFLK